MDRKAISLSPSCPTPLCFSHSLLLDVFGLKVYPEVQVLSSFVNPYPDCIGYDFYFLMAFLPPTSSCALISPACLSLPSSQPYFLREWLLLSTPTWGAGVSLPSPGTRQGHMTGSSSTRVHWVLKWNDSSHGRDLIYAGAITKAVRYVSGRWVYYSVDFHS